MEGNVTVSSFAVQLYLDKLWEIIYDECRKSKDKGDFS